MSYNLFHNMLHVCFSMRLAYASISSETSAWLFVPQWSKYLYKAESDVFLEVFSVFWAIECRHWDSGQSLCSIYNFKGVLLIDPTTKNHQSNINTHIFTYLFFYEPFNKSGVIGFIFSTGVSEVDLLKTFKSIRYCTALLYSKNYKKKHTLLYS